MEIYEERNRNEMRTLTSFVEMLLKIKIYQNIRNNSTEFLCKPLGRIAKLK